MPGSGTFVGAEAEEKVKVLESASKTPLVVLKLPAPKNVPAGVKKSESRENKISLPITEGVTVISVISPPDIVTLFSKKPVNGVAGNVNPSGAERIVNESSVVVPSLISATSISPVTVPGILPSSFVKEKLNTEAWLGVGIKSNPLVAAKVAMNFVSMILI